MNCLRKALRSAVGANGNVHCFYTPWHRQLVNTTGAVQPQTPIATIVIIGRPNVGKSTLFNRLIGRRTALVHDTPSSHVTRDYKEGLARFSDLKFHIIDTSGLEPAMSLNSVQGRAAGITQQLLDRADGVLFVTDSRSSITAADLEAADWLRRSIGKKSLSAASGTSSCVEQAQRQSLQQGPHVPTPVTVVANKCDNLGDASLVATALEAVTLGLGNPVLYSAETQAGTSDLYDALRVVVDAAEKANLKISDTTMTVEHHDSQQEAALQAFSGSSSRSQCDSLSLPFKQGSHRQSRAHQVHAWKQPFAGWTPRAHESEGPASSGAHAGTPPADLHADAAQQSSASQPSNIKHASLSSSQFSEADSLALSNGAAACSPSPADYTHSHSERVQAMEAVASQDVAIEAEEVPTDSMEMEAPADCASEFSAPGTEPQAEITQQQGKVLGKTEPIKLVLVGLPNAGKSTLLNRLLGFERALTGPEPALTRDAVVSELEWRGWRFEVTDTAGWLKQSTLKHYDQCGGRVAGMTVTQGQARINFGHAVVLLVDAIDAHSRVTTARFGVGGALSRRELALAGNVLEEGRLLMLALNKSDALDASAREAVLHGLNQQGRIFELQIDTSFASWRDCLSIAWVSGTTGSGISRVLKRITELIPLWSSVPSTLELNAWRHKMSAGLAGCGTQALTSLRFLKAGTTRPPTIMAEFRARIVDKNFQIAVSRAIRNSFSLHGVPVRVIPIAKVRRRDISNPRAAALGVHGERVAGKRPPHPSVPVGVHGERVAGKRTPHPSVPVGVHGERMAGKRTPHPSVPVGVHGERVAGKRTPRPSVPVPVPATAARR